MPPLPLPTFDSRLPQMLADIRALVEIESPTTDKAAVDRMGTAVRARMQALGARVEVNRQRAVGDHLIGRWSDGPPGGDRSQGDGILLMCHMDTVYDLGTLDGMSCREEDGRLHGPGVLDMKASIVMGLHVIAALREAGALLTRPLTLLCTSDEETGSIHSRALIEDLALQHALVLCLEPALPDGSLKTWRKGIGGFTVTVGGAASHAGADHERGVNAIEEMAHQVLKIQRLTDYEKGTTLNVGLIAGGTRTNVVPDRCTARVDFRARTAAEADRIIEVMHSLAPVTPGASLKIAGGLSRPPMPRNELMARTFQRARAIAAGLEISLGEGGTGGGSDANFVAPLGVPVLDGLGAVGNGAHSEREHIRIASLPGQAAILAALIREW